MCTYASPQHWHHAKLTLTLSQRRVETVMTEADTNSGWGAISPHSQRCSQSKRDCRALRRVPKFDLTDTEHPGQFCREP
eukprot:5039162-Pyramimonas_sp.AAC.1